MAPGGLPAIAEPAQGREGESDKDSKLPMAPRVLVELDAITYDATGNSRKGQEAAHDT
jgi:hypothetical protein